MHDSWIPVLNQTGTTFWRNTALATLQAGILTALVFTADLCLRHRVRAALRYGLWMLVVFNSLLFVAFPVRRPRRGVVGSRLRSV